MADDPPRIQEHSTEPHHDSDSSCPFCTITSTFQPIPPVDTQHSDWDPDRLSPPTYVFLATEHLVAFLDIAPLTRGHVLVTPRRHRRKVGNCTADEAAEVSATFSSPICKSRDGYKSYPASGWIELLAIRSHSVRQERESEPWLNCG